MEDSFPFPPMQEEGSEAGERLVDAQEQLIFDIDVNPDAFEYTPARQNLRQIDYLLRPLPDVVYDMEKKYVPAKVGRVAERIYSFLSFVNNYRPLALARIYLRIFDYSIFLLLFLFNLGLFFYECHGHTDLKSLGKAVGSVVHWNFALVLIPLPRKSVILWATGISFESMVIFHKWLGRAIYAMLIAHLIIFTVYYHEKDGWSGVYHEFFQKFEILAGLLSFIFLTIMVLSSIKIVRSKLYDVFMKLHYALFGVVLLFGVLHKHGDDMAVMLILPMTLMIIDWSLRGILCLYSKYEISSMRVIGNRYVRLEISGYNRYTPGQHIYLYIPSVSPVEMHPYTVISSSQETNTATVIVESVGGWSKRLKRLVDKGCSRLTVFVDGPYGTVNLPLMTQMRTLVFVAGGVGITPVLGLLRALVERAHKRSEGRQHITLIWSCRNPDLFHEMAEEMSTLQGTPDVSMALQLFHTGEQDVNVPLSDDPGHSNAFYSALQHVKPDFKQIFKSIASEAHDRADGEVGVFVCGSTRLRNGVLRGARPTTKCRFVVHTESFTA